MAYIRFSSPLELMDELALERRAGPIEKSIVRLTFLLQPTNAVSFLGLTVVVTAQVGSDLLRAETYCGTVREQEEASVPYEEAASVRSLIEERCKDIGLELREGMLETV